MECIFCHEHAAFVVACAIRSMGYDYRAECEVCGARGQTHATPEAAASEWQRIAAALHAPEVER
jgi:transcription elongation factor Elf1